jgi:glycine/D-amino acid oxidase-like deaminating enzyme
VGFALHPLKLARGLARAAIRRGAIVHGNSKVEHWETSGAVHRLRTPGGTIAARKVIVATNGYTEDRLHPAFAGVALPAISSIVVTRPLAAHELAAHGWRTGCPIWDNRHLFCYFRLLKGGRFLIGTRGNTNAAPQYESATRERLARRIAAMWPAWTGVEITHSWRGFVCLALSFAPQIGLVRDLESVAYALAYHGSGVAWANWSGRAVARLVAGVEVAIPAVLAQPLRPFPLPALRVWYLRGAYLSYGLKDIFV